ncbi:MAG TPA: hypothetical protein VG225_14735 [Terracidiphilus sp.]|jgi:hypothetical protein|nr:hypothetical protein [Terracidiphilus sp.]
MKYIPLVSVACLSLAAGIGSSALRAQQPQAAAHVLDLKGEWHIDASSAPLAAGQSLAAGQKVADSSSHQGDYITIIHDQDMSRQRFVLNGSNGNSVVVEGSAPVQSNSSNSFKGMVQAAWGVLLSKPPEIASHYALTLSRGGNAVKESEDVVMLDPAQGLFLPPAPADLPAGHYTLSVSRSGDSASAVEETGVLTSDGSWKPLPLKTLGLYEISISNDDGDPIADVMLLAVAPASYQSTREAFDSIQARARTWTGPHARSDRHLFLRSFLLSASRP